MDFQRLFLFLIFSFSIVLLWDGWQGSQQLVSQNPTSAASSVSAVPSVQRSESAKVVPSASEQLTAVPVADKSGKKIRVITDVLSLQINTIGGDIRRLEFLKQRASNDDSKPFVLMQKRESRTYITQSGLLGNSLPNHNSEYLSTQDEYELADGKDTVEVNLTSKANGIKVVKKYVFHRGSYLFDVSYEVENTGNTSFTPSAYFQFVRDSGKVEGESKLVPTYLGPAVYTAEKKFQKVDFSNIEKNKVDYPVTADNGWIGMLQHYFVAAWLPKEKSQREYFTRHLDNGLFAAGLLTPMSTIQPGKSEQVQVSLYAGPAESSLNDIAPGLGLSVDYGWLTIIATPLFWLLTLFHGWVQNWGLAIIILTVLIKLIFFPLSATSYRSMAKMRVVAPKLEKIKQQYGEDRERLHKAMMELYQTEKINPLSGCLPILIQIPVFISLYWSILASVEMRHAPFFAWINDLSSPDPYYVLPFIMAASMVLQSKLNPTPTDPIQAKVMKTMPLIFGFVFFFFPAGLVLYSVINNALSIVQQWYITRGATNEQSKGTSNA